MLEVNYPDPGFFTATSLIQLGYGIWASLTMVSLGLALGFSAVTVPQLSSPESSFVVSKSEQAWIASVIMLAAPIGCLISGFCMDRFGRRTVLIYCHLPVSAGWFYTGFGRDAKDMIIGRVITGIGIGFAMTAPRVYNTEISLPNMRGLLGAISSLAVAVGITVQSSIGVSHKWRILCHISAAFELVLFFFNFLLPETPYYLLCTKTIESAEKSLKRFRSKSYKIRTEMHELIDFKEENEMRSLTFKEQMERLWSSSACKPFGIIMTYFLITQLSGVSILVLWGIEILQRSKSSVDPHVGNVILGITRIISGLLSSTLIFRFGRRPLALVSGLGVGLVCLILGIYIHYEKNSNLLPQICYVAYIVFATIGHYTLPVIIMYELYPLQIRGILGGLSLSNICFLIFAVNVCFPHIRDILGYGNTIISFGVSSLLGCTYLYFCLPETKGLTLQEIEEYFNELRPTLVSQRRIISMQNLNKSTPGIPSVRNIIYDEPRTKIN